MFSTLPKAGGQARDQEPEEQRCPLGPERPELLGAAAVGLVEPEAVGPDHLELAAVHLDLYLRGADQLGDGPHELGHPQPARAVASRNEDS